MIVLTIAGLILAIATPRLSAFLARPQDRELKQLENFVLRAGRRAVREPLVPPNQPDAKPLRLKIVPPREVRLLRADTELMRFELAHYRIEDVEEDGRPTVFEPEFVFNAFGLVSPFALKLSGETPADRLRWRVDRLGGMQAAPAS